MNRNLKTKRGKRTRNNSKKKEDRIKERAQFRTQKANVSLSNTQEGKERNGRERNIK